MEPKKEVLLDSTYDSLINVALKKHPVTEVASHIDDRFMGYGTANDEKIFGLDGFTWMVKRQWEEMDVSRTEINQHPVSRQLFNGDNSALIVEEIEMLIHEEEETVPMSFRLSTLLEYNGKKWMILHFHGSIGDTNTLEGSAWPIEELKRRNIELEQQVAEKTSDLLRQNRELEVEAALERVRATSISMNNSDDLREVIQVLYSQFDQLGVLGFCSLDIYLEESDDLNTWVTDSSGSDYPQSLRVPYMDTPILKHYYKFRKKTETFLTEAYSQEEKNEFFRWAFENSDFGMASKEVRDHILSGPAYNRSMVLKKHWSLALINFQGYVYTDQENELLKRFTHVFDQSYTRFLDLKKAEAQTREAEVQLALERVRARTMAMQHSDELSEAAFLLAQQVRDLGIKAWGCAFHIYADDADGDYEWFSNEDGYLPFYKTPRKRFFKRFYDQREKGESLYIEEFKGKKCKDHYDYLLSLPVVGDALRDLQDNGMSLPESQIDHVAYFNYGYVLFITHDPVPEAHKIFKRFAAEFEKTYTRFLDLKKAEEQAREAKIETALEKVRSRTMGMQSSEELPEVANIMFLEVQALGIPAWSCGYCILLEDRKSSTCIMSSEGTLQKPFLLPHYGEVSFEEWDDFIQSEETFFTQELGGKAIESHYNFMKSLPQLTPIFRELEEAGLSLPTYQINHLCKISHGFLLFITYEQVPDAHDIFKRFTNVFEQTYTRFLDLKKAEKLALETARQSSLDRIRAEIGTMRSSEDLQQITPIIWDELKTLEIPFIRCGVFIIDEENGISHTYLSTSEGESIAALHLPVEGISLVENAVASWREREIYTEHWDEKDFREWTQTLIDRGFIQSKKKYEAGSAPETLDLHFLPFKHGMLYIGNTEPLSQEKLDLGQSMAKAFSVAYDRYEDFNKLEQAKQKIEEAFRELEAAKDQLVQQEKLASLGQLTAGIAHEIKNPLNFVNNFSELSVELVEEAREEVTEKLSTDSHQLTAILDDIETNLKTIHKHGTRADVIVKSMLQHSRGGSGKMEPTPLNPLIKEYVNLAYHGMRAGNDPINVDIQLNLDEKIGKVPLIAEDFSRVILNLCNNAFDAMREKLSENAKGKSEKSPFEGGSGDGPSGDYEPKLSIRTHKNGQSITIKIEDNGPGIPDDIKDKIMQPFFTTKKGTAGTGLGLSITNDIIKAHGGTLEIDSKEGDFTRFIIHMNSN